MYLHSVSFRIGVSSSRHVWILVTIKRRRTIRWTTVLWRWRTAVHGMLVERVQSVGWHIGISGWRDIEPSGTASTFVSSLRRVLRWWWSWILARLRVQRLVNPCGGCGGCCGYGGPGGGPGERPGGRRGITCPAPGCVLCHLFVHCCLVRSGTIAEIAPQPLSPCVCTASFCLLSSTAVHLPVRLFA